MELRLDKSLCIHIHITFELSSKYNNYINHYVLLVILVLSLGALFLDDSKYETKGFKVKYILDENIAVSGFSKFR